MKDNKLINLEDEGNKLTLDQYQDLRVLAKQLVPDGSVKTLINETLDYHKMCMKNGQKSLPYFGLTTDLFPSSRGNQISTKKRDLAGKCMVSLLREVVEAPSLIIDQQVMVPEDGLVGPSFTLRPRTQLGSFIYVMVLDYSSNMLSLLGDRTIISVDDRVIEQDYSIIYFDDGTMTDGTMVRIKSNIIFRNGKKPLNGIDTVSQYRVSIPNEHETVELILSRYDYSRGLTPPLRPRPPHRSNPNSGIISSNSMDKGLIKEDDDFER